jgi:23S rRNA (uracil1939-C5)-methyltransferase
VTTARTVSLEIASLAAGGDGVARADGLVVFTPRTVPGDQVTVDLRLEGRVGRGTLRRVDVPSADRVAPACAHYEAPDRCGGCQWQQVAIAAQREAKRQMVQDAFRRIAKREVPVPAIVAGEPWRYRRALTLAIRREGTRVWAGLRAFDDPEAVFALEDCLITDPRVVATWREIVAAAVHLPPGHRLRGTVRWVEERSLFVLTGGTEWPALSAFLDAVPALAAIWWEAEGKRRRLVADRRPTGIPGASFVQVNAEVAERMQSHLVAMVLAHKPAYVLDAYSGAGATAVALATAGVRVTAIELDEEAIAYAATQLTAPSRTIAARVEEALPHHLPADVVILNPPRAGVDARVTAALARTVKVEQAPRAIVYVSCDPATLARDVARLPGWRVDSLLSFDMFPQTAHVETVCVLVPEGA